jgi:hypothetical protein
MRFVVTQGPVTAVALPAFWLTTWTWLSRLVAKFHGQAKKTRNAPSSSRCCVSSGRDLEDLDDVRSELKLKVADNPVDYASPHGTLCLFLEAKALGDRFDNGASQIMGYVVFAGLLPGSRWRIATNTASTTPTPRSV